MAPGWPYCWNETGSALHEMCVWIPAQKENNFLRCWLMLRRVPLSTVKPVLYWYGLKSQSERKKILPQKQHKMQNKDFQIYSGALPINLTNSYGLMKPIWECLVEMTIAAHSLHPSIHQSSSAYSSVWRRHCCLSAAVYGRKVRYPMQRS